MAKVQTASRLALTRAGEHSCELMRNWLLQLKPAAVSSVTLAALLLLTGCGKTAISVYNVPKEDGWTLPAGWQEKEAGGMRAARFSVPSTNGTDLDVSIIPIRGFGGTTAEILNIWRQQLKLEPVSNDEDAAKAAEKVTLGKVDGQLYDLTSPEPVLEGKGKARSLIAAVRHDATLWFVKMSGDEAAVGLQKAAFLSFLKGVNLNNITPPAMPQMGAGGGGPGENPHAPSPSGGAEGHNHATHPEWTVPEGWTEQPVTQFLNAKFSANGEGGAKVDVNVSVSPGDGGGVAANINRWRGQLGLAPWSDADVDKNAMSVDAVGTKAILVDFQGTDARTSKPARLIGIIVPLQGNTWFYKMMGDEKVAEREKPALIKLVATAKHPNG